MPVLFVSNETETRRKKQYERVIPYLIGNPENLLFTTPVLFKAGEPATGRIGEWANRRIGEKNRFLIFKSSNLSIIPNSPDEYATLQVAIGLSGF